MFRTVATRMRTFICIDAIDECAPEHRVVVLDSLGQIPQGSPNTRVFMTGRPHVRSEIEERLGGPEIFISVEPKREDVLSYLLERLRKDTTPRIMNSKLEVDIMKVILEMSSETYVGEGQWPSYPKTGSDRFFKYRFLLVSLHIDGVLREVTISRRAARLMSMNKGQGLGGAYDATLERIRSQGCEKVELALATLMWVCHSERPLRPDELCHALGVEIGSTDFDPGQIPLIDTLLCCCQGLIMVDKEASTVRLIHHTLQEYLSTLPDLFTKVHSTIAETCLTYLNSQRVKKLPPHPLPNDQSMPFLKYSSRYWGTHAKRELSDHIMSLSLELLSSYETHISAISLLRQSPVGRDFDDCSGSVDGASLFSGLLCIFLRDRCTSDYVNG